MEVSRQPIGQLVIDIPGSAALFDALGIDYACAGTLTLADVCERAEVGLHDLEMRLTALRDESAHALRPAIERAGIEELVDYIVFVHHETTWRSMFRIRKLLPVVVGSEGATHRELYEVDRLCRELFARLSDHLVKEECILFPQMRRIEHDGAPLIRGPMCALEMDHADVSRILHELVTAADGYEPPPDASARFRALYSELADLQVDLRRHIHLENNALFPRAREILAERTSALAS